MEVYDDLQMEYAIKIVYSQGIPKHTLFSGLADSSDSI